jgi:membrane protein DedA with SNARE-associated domain
MEKLIERFGTLAIFLGAGTEGDASALVGGVVAHLGFLSFPAALIAAMLGAAVGDLVLFSIGRAGATRIRASRAYRRVAPVVERMTARFGAVEIVLARFVYGTRVASMVFWGVRGTPPARFLAIDLVGCALWASVFTSLGFAASGTAEVLLGKVQAAERWLLVALVAAIVVAAVVHLLVRRRLPANGAAADGGR